jgi:hypothetical protein
LPRTRKTRSSRRLSQADARDRALTRKALDAMTPDEFRALALSFPGAVEGKHMDHPDFRVGGKIFAGLGPDGDWGMVKLSPGEQATATREEPQVFVPFPGAWGRRGYTRVLFRMASASTESVRQALLAAWRNTAPKRMLGDLTGW